MMERLLITTRTKVLLWDEGPHIIREEQRPGGARFYGLTWDTKKIYVMTSTCMLHTFDRGLNWKGQVGVKVTHPHQIFWWDGTLYIADARTNTIALWDGSRIRRRVTWKKKDESQLHTNSIWCDGESFYVVEHRRKKLPKRIRVLNLNLKPTGCIEIKREGFTQPRPRGLHNVYVEGDFLYTCSPRALVRHNLLSGRSEPIVPHPLMDEAHFVIGLARVPGKFFIGVSEAKPRDERGEGDSMILVTDDNFNVLDILLLKDTGTLHEIRVIDGSDLAHNRIRCPYG